MLIVVVIPLWEASRLLSDPTFVFFLGRGLPGYIVAACLLSLLVYGIGMFLFFTCTLEEYRSEQSLMMAFASILALLGFCFLALSTPLQSQANVAFSELFFDCQHGATTQALFEYSSVLLALRAQPACAARESVEECQGYQDSNPYTGFLKALEQTYHCAGFCQLSAVAANATAVGNSPSSTGARRRAITAALAARAAQDEAAARSLAVAALQERPTWTVSGTRRETAAEFTLAPGQTDDVSSPFAAPKARPSRMQGRLAAALVRQYGREESPQRPGAARPAAAQEEHVLQVEDSSGEDVAFLQEGNEVARDMPQSDQPAGEVDLGKVGAYPPTLFSAANYQASCDGMAGRALRYQAIDAANLLFVEGMALLLVAVLIALLRVGAMCSGGASSVQASLSRLEAALDSKPRAKKEILI